MAMAVWPTATFESVASTATGRSLFTEILTTATSVALSAPTTLPVVCVPSARRTCMVEFPDTTWAAVRIRPLLS